MTFEEWLAQGGTETEAFTHMGMATAANHFGADITSEFSTAEMEGEGWIYNDSMDLLQELRETWGTDGILEEFTTSELMEEVETAEALKHIFRDYDKYTMKDLRKVLKEYRYTQEQLKPLTKLFKGQDVLATLYGKGY